MPSITDSIGRVLGDRYRLVTAVGTGASAHVYLAEDVNLHRQVAIKVLHPALAHDASFLKRFRAEARAVAALNHPNVLQVYDWGEDADGPFLVLEYLAGGSLRRVLDRGARLTPEQAVNVGRQAAAGLAYAHRRGLAHRDVKPENLLFDTDERLRIADFGLARALAEAAWTEPEGTVLGTARYASPEQALAHPIDGRADVYALSLVLFEAVTGGVPFVGDTSLATLSARVGALLPEHPDLGPLYDVLLWGAAPEVEERIDAEELGRRLAALSVSLPAPEPLVLPGAPSAGGGTVDPAEAPTELGASLTEIGAPVVPPPGVGPGTSRGRRRRGAVPVVPVGGPAAVPGASPVPGAVGDGGSDAAADGDGGGTVEPGGSEAAGTQRDGRDRPRRWPWVAAVIVLVLALAGAGTAVAVESHVFTPTHPIPSLVGKTVPAATAATRADHFPVRVTGHTFSITTPAGVILTQQPGPTPRHGAGARQGTVISVTVSAGLPPVTIPNLTTFSSCKDAIAALAAIHLVAVCPSSVAQYSPTVPSGAILGSSPTQSALYGSTVTIITSKGHAPVTVPAVAGVGTTYAGAVTALQGAGFQVKRIDEYSSTVAAGAVIGTTPDPSAGPQPYGSTVTVAVSLGPKPVPVPDVTDDSIGQAESALQAAGLVVGGAYGPPKAKVVIGTDPAAGTVVLPGTTVYLYVG